MLSHSLCGSEQAAENLAHSNEWKIFFQAITCQVFMRVFVTSYMFILISYLIFSDRFHHVYKKHKVMFFLLEKATASFFITEIRVTIRNMFCFVPEFSEGACYRPHLLASLYHDGWGCWDGSEFRVLWCPSNNRPRLKGCQLVESI